MLIYILFIALIVILIGSYFLYKKDIIEPSIVLVAAYILSVFCVIVNINKWGVQLSNKAFWILLLGTLEFVIISFLINKIFERRNKKILDTETKNEIKEKSNVKVSKIMTIAIILYNIMILILLVFNVLKIASDFGTFSSFSEALTIYKSNTSYANNAELPDYLTILMKPIIASAYIYIFFFIKNVIYAEGKKYKAILKYWYYLIPTIIYFLQRLAESNRGSIINFVLSAIVMYFVMWNIKNEWKSHVKVGTMVKLAISGVACLVIFYFSATLVGRVNSKGLIDYITCYCGGSIECFNLYIQEEDSIRVMRGEETFGSTIRDLGKLGIIDREIKVTTNAPFRYYGENMIGNVYSSYKRWMHDYGIFGIIVLQAALAMIFSVSYNIIKYWKHSEKLRDLVIIFYSYFMYTIFMHPIDSLFYLETFTIYTAGVILFIVAMYWVLTLDKSKNKEEDKKKDKEFDKKNIKILNITPCLNLCGGIESYSMNYYRNMGSNIHIDFITHEIKDKNYKEEIEKNGDKVFLLKPIKLKNILKNINEIKEFFIQNNDYDIIHCNMANAAIFYFYYAKKFNINVRILHSHQDNYADKFLHKVRNIPLIYFGKKYTTVNFACSKIAGDFLFKKDKYHIINNAINVEIYKYNSETRKEFREKFNIKENEIAIGTVGRLTEQKNQMFLLEIMNEIIKHNENYKLFIIGEGHLKERLKEKCKELGLNKKVVFIESVNNVQDYLQMLDVFVLPSLYEGLGIVNIEAQASGLPTIVSDKIPDSASVTDLIKYISLEQDEVYWAKEIMKINRIKNREAYNEKVESSIYNIREQAKELEKLYIEIIEQFK